MNPNPKWWRDFAAIPPIEKEGRWVNNLVDVFKQIAEEYRKFVEGQYDGFEHAAPGDCPGGECDKLKFTDAEMKAVFHWAYGWYGGKDGRIGDRVLARRYWGLLYGWNDGRWVPGFLAVMRFREVTPIEERKGRITPKGGQDELDAFLVCTDFKKATMFEVLDLLAKEGFCTPSSEDYLRKRVERLFTNKG